MADTVFDLDAVFAEQRQAPFRFKWDGREWELPHLHDIDIHLLNRIHEAESFSADEVMDLFPQLFAPRDRVEWLKTPQPALMLTTLFTQWMEHVGVTPGESVGSGDSSSSTEPKSKQTSTGSTASASPKRSSRRPRKTATPPANS